MYASKRRQRNFKRVRECAKPAANSNPSKRHRERLNGELETVAALLPFDEVTLQRLDKLSVLRLAVSFLQIKAHFHACFSDPRRHVPYAPHAMAANSVPMGPIPSFVDPHSGFPLIDPLEPLFAHVALRALGGFLLILNEHGEIYYVSENIEFYLGFLQSDILHQPIFEMIHSEDREDIRLGLQLRPNAGGKRESEQLAEGESVERLMVARFRCLLDNTCGFMRIEIRGRFIELHATTSGEAPESSSTHRNTPRYGLLAVCTPFVPPIQLEIANEDPILKTKHALDLTLLCMDNRFRMLIEADDSPVGSFYSLIHPADVRYVSEAHSAVVKNTSSGLMIYRLVARLSGEVVYVQSSLRVFFKNSKAESIGATHRVLNEVDGLALLEKRSSMKAKYLTFDDTLLQNPRQLSSVASLQQQPQQANPFLLRDSSSKAAYEQLATPEVLLLNGVMGGTQATTSTADRQRLLSQLTGDLQPTTSAVLPIHSSPSTSVERPAVEPPGHFALPAPLLPLPFGEHPAALATDIRGLTTHLPHCFPAPAEENFWLQGFKRPFEMQPEGMPAPPAYYPPPHFDPAAYCLDYAGHPPMWPMEPPPGIPPDYHGAFHGIPLAGFAPPPPTLPELMKTGHELLQRPEHEVVQRCAPVFPPPAASEPFEGGSNFNFISEVAHSLLGHN